jgi:putative transposase
MGKKKSKTPSFVTEIPLAASPCQETELLARLEVGRQVYNACLGESLKRSARMRESKAYQGARNLPKGQKDSPQAKARTQAFRTVREVFGFDGYPLHAYAGQFGHSWIGEHLDSLTVQAITTRAFKAVTEYTLGKTGKPRFKGKNQFDSVEGKTNTSGILWRDSMVKWSGLELSALIDPSDPVIAHGLACRIKYVRIVRRKLNGRNRFYVQLVNEGQPYRKPKHPLGQGVVGIDIGPSTIAVVSEQDAFLEQFCSELLDKQKQIRRLQRQLDCQRRAGNPANYNPNGIVEKGAKTWRKSARQKRTQAKLAELQRKFAAHRKSLHGHMVNRVLGMGDTFKLEKLSYRAFQRRYGKSVGQRAPGMFVSHLRRKAGSAGGEVDEFPTRPTRLSQTCHCGMIEQKPLSQRWHRCACEVVAQRDLYSAFLASCVEGERLNAGLAQMRWPGVDTLLRAAMSRIEPAIGGRLPASFGIQQSQSRLPVKAMVKTGEAHGVVPVVSLNASETMPAGVPCS